MPTTATCCSDILTNPQVHGECRLPRLSRRPDLHHLGLRLWCADGELLVDGKKASVETVWRSKELDNHHGGVVLLDGYLYGAAHQRNGGRWICLAWNDGAKRYAEKGVGKGSLTCADGMLYCWSESGQVGLVPATPEKHEPISRFTVAPGGDGPTWRTRSSVVAGSISATATCYMPTIFSTDRKSLFVGRFLFGFPLCNPNSVTFCVPLSLTRVAVVWYHVGHDSTSNPKVKTMPRNNVMTWNRKQKRWFKKSAGKQYVVSCRVLSKDFPDLYQSDTEEGSYRAANAWWRERDIEGKTSVVEKLTETFWDTIRRLDGEIKRKQYDRGKTVVGMEQINRRLRDGEITPTAALSLLQRIAHPTEEGQSLSECAEKFLSGSASRWATASARGGST